MSQLKKNESEGYAASYAAAHAVTCTLTGVELFRMAVSVEVHGRSDLVHAFVR